MPTQNDSVPTMGDGAATGLTVRLRPARGRAVVLAFEGDLDIETLGRARPALDETIAGHPSTLVVDLGAVGFCDSSGLNLLLKARMAAVAADIRLRLAAPSSAVSRLLELTGADSVFAVHPSVDAALADDR
ncbi:STAS domain-containing protein [Kitasatospora sp. NPDC049285]|uniref:STAS domain-containing protein n=1 Tax=Kitasatospora sp. NPDC049285 TaxID=3157096 RepID=UPI00344772FB